MKLYIKANNLKILKNMDTLLPFALSKTHTLLDKNSNIEYITNIQSTIEIQKHQNRLFYDKRELYKLIKGIYFGNSSCEHLIPTIKELIEARSFCEQRHYNFVFVFPPVSQNKSEEVRYICELLANKPNTEVVVNDIGVLNIVLENKNLKAILGVNFTKVIKNSFLDNVSQYDISKIQLQNQKELLSHCEFENIEVREFYKSLDIKRVSIENINLNTEFFDTVPKMQCDFYYPNITIANSKACDIAGCFEDERGYFVKEECSKYCNFASLEFTHSDILGLRQRYNTVYKTNISLDIPKIVYKNNRNRFIWEILP
ncbi:MAG: hypothetical protein ACNI3C_00495 [Candidatus Marinarcus sp.]|uniref:hypothetical protein n=1 Tax=Candidatus Marinarcus sp. TaxID=3100987 RepID=UPI003AFFBEC4